jgi:HlyD family secretion protein
VTQNEVRGRVRFSKSVPEGLRQNQRVAVRIVMDRRDGVLKVERGAFYEADAGQSAYVVRGDVAERAPIRSGATSVREVEILEGLTEGDQIIVSDTDTFGDATRIHLSN